MQNSTLNQIMQIVTWAGQFFAKMKQVKRSMRYFVKNIDLKSLKNQFWISNVGDSRFENLKQYSADDSNDKPKGSYYNFLWI